MKKKFLTVATFLALKSISQIDFDGFEAEKRNQLLTELAKENEEYFKELENSIENKLSKEEIKALETKQTEILAEIERLGMELKSLEEKPKGENKLSLVEELKTKKEELKQVGKGVSTKEIELKAITNRASISGNTDAFKLPDIGQLGVKERSLYNVFPKITLSAGDHNGVIRYHDWDEDTTVRAAAMVAEGNAFPESTAKFQQYSLPLRKIGDTLTVTEEFFEDEVQASAELELFLDTNVNSKIDNEIVTGDGTGQRLTGLMTSVPAYTPVASGIVAPNIYDLVKKMKTDIVKNRGSKYRPNIVVMNSDTADRLGLTKDANENYIFKDVNNIGQMIIIEDNNMADNQLVVGDSRYGRIYELGGITMAKGEVNQQFIEDTMTLKVRKRMLFLIRNVDKTGFRKVTNITSALATLGS